MEAVQIGMPVFHRVLELVRHLGPEIFECLLIRMKFAMKIPPSGKGLSPCGGRKLLISKVRKNPSFARRKNKYLLNFYFFTDHAVIRSARAGLTLILIDCSRFPVFVFESQ